MPMFQERITQPNLVHLHTYEKIDTGNIYLVLLN